MKGELSRLLRACSDSETYEELKKKMTTIFQDRGYPKSLIVDTIQQVPFTHRESILYDPNEPSPYETFMVLTYTPDLDVKYL